MSTSSCNDYAQFIYSVTLSSPSAEDGAMRAVVDSLPAPLLIVNRLNLITYLNRGAERLLGVEADKVLGRDWAETVKICDRNGRAVTCRLMEMHTSVWLPDSREWWLLQGQNGEVPVQLSVAPIREPDLGHCSGYVAMFHEVTELQQMLAPVYPRR